MILMLHHHPQAGVDEQTAELIAARVTAILREDIEALLATFIRRESSNGNLTVEQLAAQLGVARSTVYAHWREWGGYKLGSGPKAPIRFNPDTMPNARRGAAGVAPPQQQLARRSRRRRAELIPDTPRLARSDELLDGRR
jgi:transposase-like protein